MSLAVFDALEVTGYEPGADVPTLVQVLDGAPPAVVDERGWNRPRA